MQTDKENRAPRNAFSLLSRATIQKAELNSKVVARKSTKVAAAELKAQITCNSKALSQQTVISKFFGQTSSKANLIGSVRTDDTVDKEKSECVVPKSLTLQFNLVTVDGKPFESTGDLEPDKPSSSRGMIRGAWFEKLFPKDTTNTGFSNLSTPKGSATEFSPYASDAPKIQTPEQLSMNQDANHLGSNSLSSYSSTIFRYLRTVECLYTPTQLSHTEQLQYWNHTASPICAQERTTAVRWILRTCRDFSMTSQTGYLAVNLLDRFFESRVRANISNYLSSNKYFISNDCVVLACLYIAYKHTEVKNYEYWHVLDLKTYQENTYSKERIQATESAILQALSYKLNFYGPKCFIDHIVTEALHCSDVFRPDTSDSESFVEGAILSLLLSGKIYEQTSSRLAVGMVYLLILRQPARTHQLWDQATMRFTLYSEKEALTSATHILKSLYTDPDFLMYHRHDLDVLSQRMGSEL